MGIDDGGPRKEFMRLCLKAIRDSQIFKGHMNSKYICPDIKSEESDLYYLYGYIIAYIVVHGGPFPQFFSETLYTMVAFGPEHCSPSLNDITDFEVKTQIEQVVAADDNISYSEALTPLLPLLDFCGAINLTIKLEDREQLISTLINALITERTSRHLERFKKGLECLGFLYQVQKHPNVMKDVFVESEKVPLDALDFEELFTVNFSEEGSNLYRLELRGQSHWRDFLQDLEEEQALNTLLEFITCLDNVPVFGFDPHPSISFSHTEETPYANTCANSLTLPILEEYEIFKRTMLAALELGKTFTNA